jgi:hypothetical protein
MFPVAAALLGLLLGARHALEPDHVAAVGTLTATAPGGLRGARLGAAWGVGHALTIGFVALALGAAQVSMPADVARALEALVGVMLVALGARALVDAARSGRSGEPSTHRHGALLHAHAAPAAHVHVGSLALATRPLLVGVVHGLAGSGALVALAAAEAPDPATRTAWIGAFALGSVAGMSLVSAAAGAALGRLGAGGVAIRVSTALAGAAAIAIGVHHVAAHVG